MMRPIGLYCQGLRSPFVRLGAAVLAGYVALGAGLQVLPGDAHERFGASAGEVGAVVTAAALAAVVARPLAGWVADRSAARPVVVAGGALAALGALGQLLAPSLAALVAARLLVGAGEGALFTGALTWVLRVAPAERRGRIVGRFGLSMWGGLAAGPPLGALLAAAAGTTAVWLAALALPLAALIAIVGLDEPRPAAARSQRPTSVSRLLARPALALGLAAYGVGTLQAFAVLRLAGNGADAGLGVFGAAFLLVRFAASPLVDRHRPARLMAACAVLEALGLGALACTGAVVPGLLGAALAGAGTALVYPVLATAVASAAEPAARGAAVGALTSCWDLGIAIAGPLGGIAAGAGGLATPFAIAAAGALAAALPLLGATLRPPVSPEEPRAHYSPAPCAARPPSARPP